MTCSKLNVLHYVTPHITCIQVLGEDWMISDLIFVNCCCCSMPGPGAGAVPARTPEDGERLRLSASRLSLSDDEERRGGREGEARKQMGRGRREGVPGGMRSSGKRGNNRGTEYINRKITTTAERFSVQLAILSHLA